MESIPKSAPERHWERQDNVCILVVAVLSGFASISWDWTRSDWPRTEWIRSRAEKTILTDVWMEMDIKP